MELSKEELKQQFEDMQLGKLKRFNNGTFSSENNRRYLLELFIEKLFEDDIINDIDNIPQIINYKLFNKYKLHKLLTGHFSGSFIKAINFLYPNRWQIWEFNCNHVSNGTWDNYNNVKMAIRDMVLNKININSYEDIFLITEKHFKEYKIAGILNTYNNNIPKLLQDAFPEYYLPVWRFKYVSNGYWDNKENRIIAFKELIEDYLKLSIDDIPKIITANYLKTKYPKFYNVYKNIYHNNIFQWVNEVYPNKFKPEDFIEIKGSDGTKLASREENLIHDLLLDNFQDVIYFENTNDKNNKLYNSECNEGYVPDWILDNKIIVEYFGLYAPNRTTKFSQKYNQRTQRKIKFYDKYCDENQQYFFIALYSEDLKNNLNGVKEKLNIA